MRDNYIIGALLGILAAKAGFWQYSNTMQPILVALTVGFVAAWLKRVVEDDIRALVELMGDTDEN